MFQTMPIFVYELFETMQSSVTESRTFATKSLPASLKYCNYLLIYSKLQQNIKFYTGKLLVSTIGNYHSNLSGPARVSI